MERTLDGDFLLFIVLVWNKNCICVLGLNPFPVNGLIFYLLKYQKTKGFLVVSGDLKRE